jgi:thioredoxin-like negative regulator of GroEL
VGTSAPFPRTNQPTGRMATTETDAPIAIQLAKQLDGGYQEERDAAESLLDYLNEDGTVMDLSDHLGLLEARFKGLAYELASACALAQARVTTCGASQMSSGRGKTSLRRGERSYRES